VRALRTPPIPLVICLVLLSVACSRQKAEEPKAPASVEELKKAIADVLSTHHVPGAGIAVVARDRVIWAGGVGKANLASGKAVDADTIFRIGSISKGFVALSLLQLQERGKTSLETSVSEVAPELHIANRWERSDPVRIAHLLEHTAGLDDFRIARFFDLSDVADVPLLEVFRMFPLHVRWRPGTFASYSSLGYGVAGYVVEKISGQPWSAYVAENILRPLKMTHSDARLTADVQAALAQGYDYDPPRPIPYRRLSWSPGGEMKSSPNEMARFVRMMLNRGTLDGVRVVSQDSIARMETPQTGLAARHGLKNGYGLGIWTSLDVAFLAHGHGGELAGFLSQYEYLPEQGLGYFFSINDSRSRAAVWEIRGLILRFLTHTLTPPPQPKAVPLDAQIRSATGFYEFASPRRENRRFLDELLGGRWFYLDHGKLYHRGWIPGTGEELIYLGNNLFRGEDALDAQAVFVADEEGGRYVCGDMSCYSRRSALWPVTRLVLIGAALLTMASSIVFALVWIPRKLLGRMQGVEHFSVRVVPLLAVMTLAATVWLGFATPPLELTQVNAVTIALCLGSIAFAILSVASLVVASRSIGFEMNRGTRIHSMLVALSCCGLTSYLAYWGAIGVRTWRW
jgi:CubicO group peptidase (beta-lactamase class C family)